MKSLSLRVAARVMQVALTVAVLGCGGRVDVGGAGAGGSTGAQGGAGAVGSSCGLAIGAACDCSVSLTCPEETVKGIPCCSIAKMCSGEEACVVAWTGAICHDWCDTSCEMAQDPAQCAAIGCNPTTTGCTSP